MWWRCNISCKFLRFEQCIEKAQSGKLPGSYSRSFTTVLQNPNWALGTFYLGYNRIRVLFCKLIGWSTTYCISLDGMSSQRRNVATRLFRISLQSVIYSVTYIVIDTYNSNHMFETIGSGRKIKRKLPSDPAFSSSQSVIQQYWGGSLQNHHSV